MRVFKVFEHVGDGTGAGVGLWIFREKIYLV